MRTIRVKFTIVFTFVLTLMVVTYGLIMYSINIRPATDVAREQYFNSLIDQNPRIEPFLTELKDQELKRLHEFAQDVETGTRKTVARSFLYFMLPLIVVSGLFAYLTAILLTDPIYRLQREVEKIDGVDLSKRITTRKTSEEINYLRDSFNQLLSRVENAFTSQERFMQDVAHELRTPLASIKAGIAALKSKKDPSEKDYKQAIEEIEKLNENLIKISEDLIFLDRKSDTKVQSVVVEEIVEDILDSLHSQILKKKLNLLLNIEDGLTVDCDCTNFIRALQNIIENAVKYSVNEGSNISIEAKSVKGVETAKGKKAQDRIQIRIKDEGIGIAPEDLNKIFNRFYRGNNSRSKIEGTGLGLAIAIKVVEKMDGKIDVESILGKGSTFTIDIPKRAD